MDRLQWKLAEEIYPNVWELLLNNQDEFEITQNDLLNFLDTYLDYVEIKGNVLMLGLAPAFNCYRDLGYSMVESNNLNGEFVYKFSKDSG